MPVKNPPNDVLVIFFTLGIHKIYIKHFELLQITGTYMPVFCMDKTQALQIWHEHNADWVIDNIDPACARDYQTEWVKPMSYDRINIFETLVNI
jgi:hypothetical protein